MDRRSQKVNMLSKREQINLTVNMIINDKDNSISVR